MYVSPHFDASNSSIRKRLNAGTVITNYNGFVRLHTVTQRNPAAAGTPVTKGAGLFAYIFALLERVKIDRNGVTAMEYGVIAAGIVISRRGCRFAGIKGLCPLREHRRQALTSRQTQSPTA